MSKEKPKIDNNNDTYKPEEVNAKYLKVHEFLFSKLKKEFENNNTRNTGKYLILLNI